MDRDDRLCMAEVTGIAWTHSTFNPWMGCSKLTEGCRGCYAEKNIAVRMLGVKWGNDADRREMSDDYWKRPFVWDRKAAETGQPWRVFGGSLCDWLDPRAPEGQLDRLLDVIHQTWNLTWLQLTKRGERLQSLEDIPLNAWIGVTAENQQRLLERVDHLRNVDAIVRWVSYEPAIWPINLNELPAGSIDWLVCGCESGKQRRPMDIRWARDARDQCRELGISFFMKQMEINGEVTDNVESFPDDLQVRQYPEVA